MWWRKRRKTLLVLSGILYVIFGVLAFFNVPGGHDEHHHTFAHNITHILLGVVLLVITLSSKPSVRRSLCLFFAATYFALGIIGAFVGPHATLVVLPRVVEFHAGDYAVHLATALFFLILASFKRSDEVTTQAGA